MGLAPQPCRYVHQTVSQALFLEGLLRIRSLNKNLCGPAEQHRVPAQQHSVLHLEPLFSATSCSFAAPAQSKLGL